jgi:hypothetical protein
LNRRPEGDVLTHGEYRTCGFGRMNEGIALSGIGGHRLFQQHVFPSQQGGSACLHVQVRRNRQNERSDAGMPDRFFPTHHNVLSAKLVTDAACTSPVLSANQQRAAVHFP